MKKKIFARKLTLQRETLRSLEGAQLQEAAGGLTVNGSCCNSSCDTDTLVGCVSANHRTCEC
jgi:hypothetical protein